MNEAFLFERFSTLLQLCATFFVALIVIEHAKSYTSLLARNLFNFSGRLDTLAKSNRMDENAELDEFKDERFSEGKPLRFLETTKSKILELNTSITDTSKELEQFIKDKCNFEHFRSISLHMFVYCLEMLLLAGVCNKETKMFVYGFSQTHFFTSFVFVVLCFIAGMFGWLTKETNRTLNNVITVVYLFLTILASFLSGFNNWPVCNTPNVAAWNTNLLCIVFLPLSTFLIGVLYVWIIGLRINKEICSSYSEIIGKRAEIIQEIEDWKTHDRVEEKYEE